MKRVIKIHIEVDMENPESKNWAKVNDFIESEIDEVMSDIKDIRKPQVKDTKYSTRNGATKFGTQYSIVSRKSKEPLVIFFEQ